MSTTATGRTDFLDDLQVQMEEIGLQRVPNLGRFCGFCYGRLPDGAEGCRFCEHTPAEFAPLNKVPIYVLRVYLAKRRREGIMVNLFAFLGLFLAVVLSGVIYFFLVGNWRVVSLFVLLGAGWYFANLLGYQVGAVLGYRWGRTVRDRYWVQYVEDRRNGVAPEI